LASANGNVRSITGCKRCCAMARFIASKSARLPTLIAPTVMPRPVSNNGSSIAPDGDRLAPVRLRCPPTAKAFSDFAIVRGPPISTTQSTPRPSVNSRAFTSQSGVSV
jgi:hypothetical protein